MHPGARGLIKEFAGINIDAEAVQQALSMPEPSLQYLIFFTPRSGSTWLTELLSSNIGFGNPSEWFNVSLMPDVARNLGVDNTFDYVSLARRSMSDPRTRVFGAELTFFQLEVMRELVDFFSLFPTRTTKTFYLNRIDIIAQAVSLWRAVKSGKFHMGDFQAGDAPQLEYDPEEIAYWLDHIRRQERGLEYLFRERELVPVRICYEEIVKAAPQSVLDIFSHSLFSRSYEDPVIAPTENQRLPTGDGLVWISRFRADRAELCEEIERERRETIAREK